MKTKLFNMHICRPQHQEATRKKSLRGW